jgi:long-chain acyl-CoA synthetase
LDLGVAKGDRVAIISENRPEWVTIDLAVLHVGAVTVAIYPTLSAEETAYILSDSGARVIFVENARELSKVEHLSGWQESRIILIEGGDGPGAGLMTLDGLVEDARDTGRVDATWKEIAEDDLAAVIYTSGTTGGQKGAMLTHRNFATNIEACKEILRFGPGEVALVVLPLNHVFGRLVQYYLGIASGCTLWFVENMLHLREAMKEARPHYVCVVPRMLEMMKEAVLRSFERQGTLPRALFRLGLMVDQDKRPRCWQVPDRLIFRKIRSELGLDRLHFILSGGAALSIETALFFHRIGIHIVEGYGLTETSPVVSLNRPGALRFGTVGPPVNGVEVRIAADGEILVRGENVMKGYLNLPRETEEAIDSDGWFATGDIGFIDGTGCLRITDRKKDLIVLSNGRKVAPQPLESRLRESAFISQALLFGDEEGRISAVIVPSFEGVKAWMRESGLDGDLDDMNALLNRREVVKLIRGEVYRLTNRFNDFDSLHRLTLLSRDFTIEDGELTPTLKVRRHIVRSKILEGPYHSAGSAGPSALPGNPSAFKEDGRYPGAGAQELDRHPA